MPQPRRHGGAALVNIPLVIPGFKGLNKQSSSATLGPEWATVLREAVIDDSNRLAARKGYTDQTTTPAASAFTQLFEYRQYDTTVELFAGAASAAIYKSTDGGDTWSAVTGTATHASTNIQFHNFHDNIVGVTDDGENPILYTGTTFSDIVDGGNQPTGSVGLAAFGRMWITGLNNTSIQYSVLLDETDWTSTGAGSIDMRNIWPDGDTVTAMAAFNGALVVFGKRNIAIFTDGAGSELGINPENAYLADTINGVGCIARDTVQNIEGDLWFLSDVGLMSLTRLIQEKSNPLNNLSKNVQDYLRDYVNDSTASSIRSAYVPDERIYVLALGTTTLVFDTRGRLEDGSARCLGNWSFVPTASAVRANGDWLFALSGAAGEVYRYGGSTDNSGTISFDYKSGWIDLTKQGYLILPKRIDGVFFLGAATTVTVKWGFDFNTDERSAQVSFADINAGAEFGVAKFNVDEWGGGSALRNGRIAGGGTGEYVRLGVSAAIGGDFAIQQLDLFAKIGRYA